MADFTSKLLRSVQVAEGTMEFFLEKPEGFTFTPGQHASFHIVNPLLTDSEGDTRTFSFVTIPTDPEVSFTTRMRNSAFKTNFKNAKEGLKIEIKNPRGSMVLPADVKRPLVLLAGGIGITPLISMIKQATHLQSDQKIYLFYANRTVAQAAFFQELEDLAQKNTNFIFIPTMTKEDPTKWQGETGYITQEMLLRHLPTTDNTLFYLAGPSAMVSGMVEMLTEAGIDDLFIKSEDYGEYK